MNGPESWGWKVGEFVVFIIGMFGINKAMNSGLSKRISALENAPACRLVDDCEKLMGRCPSIVHLEGIEKWMSKIDERVESMNAKLDRAIEREIGRKS